MQRAGIIRLDLERLIEARDRGFIIAGVEMKQRTAVRRFKVARIGLESLIEAQAGFIAPLLLQQELAEPVPARGKIGLKHQAAIIAFNRVVNAALVLQDDGEIEKIVGDIGIPADRLGEPLHRYVILPRDLAQQPHQVQRICVVGVDGQRLPARAFRFCKLTGTQQAKRRLKEGSRRRLRRSYRNLAGLLGGRSSLLTVHRRHVRVAMAQQ